MVRWLKAHARNIPGAQTELHAGRRDQQTRHSAHITKAGVCGRGDLHPAQADRQNSGRNGKSFSQRRVQKPEINSRKSGFRS
mmetsp:Transcript_15117/g.26795  ORF Transcript_15117/g.26795 Transcript_15117/m.26795 type:complete len:82 (-) Transcript_15117:351-596(-)